MLIVPILETTIPAAELFCHEFTNYAAADLNGGGLRGASDNDVVEGFAQA
jgi:hypothetical protein